MGFAGDLTTIGLAEIFQNIAFNRLSGTMSLTSGERAAHIYFDSGVLGMLSVEDEPMDYFAIAADAQLADETVLQAARKKSRRIGLRAALAKVGACDETAFDEAVAARVEENMLLLFGWTSASFTFEEGKPDEDLFDREQRDSTIALDPQGLAMEAARRLDEWETISRHIGSEKEIFLPPHDESAETDPNLQDLFALMDGVNDLGAVIGAMPASKFEVMKLVASLVDCGRLVRATAPHLRDLSQRAAATGEPDRAIRHLEAALEREHGALDIRRELAKLYEKTNRKDEAAREHKKIAFDLTASGEVRLALEVYERAATLAPSDTGTLQKIADIHETGGDQEAFRKSGRRLGETLVAQGLYEDALKVYKRLSKTDQYNVGLRESLAEIHVKLNKPKEAAKEFLPLAERAYKRGDYTEALRQYRNVIRVDRGCAHAAERIDEIESGRIRQTAVARRRRMVVATVALAAALLLWQGSREALATEALQRASISAAIEQPRHTAQPGGIFALERFAQVRTDFPGTLAAGRADEAVQMLVLSELDRMTKVAKFDPAAVEANVRRIDNVELSEGCEALWVDGRDRLLSTVRRVLERTNVAAASE